MKALIYGGAFNPPTIAHIELADFARRAAGFDKVIFVPSKMRYITEDQKKSFAFDDETRLAMLRDCAKYHEWMEVSDFEIMAEEQPRTYITMTHLEEQGYLCKLLFGSDKLPELSGGWKYVDELCRHFGICCMVRNNEPVEEMIASDPFLSSYADCIEIIHTPADYQEVSSSIVRELYTKIKELEGQMYPMVPEAIRHYLD